jgi:Uma2 family endonuclease
MVTAPKPRLTVEEYLAQELVAEFKSEYFDGETFAMAGPSRRHGLIVTNLSAELRQALRKKPCNVYSTDIRLGIPKSNLYTYPDVMVTCGKEEVRDETSETLLNPVLIIEVLSESKKDYDRGGKFEHYRPLDSLREYLTVAQDKVHVEQWVRQPDNRWLLTEHSQAGATLSLSIDVDLKLSDIYEKVSLGPV